MKYAIIDAIENGDRYEKIFDTEAAAVAAADREWAHLSAYNQRRREFFAVMAGELDEDGCFEVFTARVVKLYEEAEA